MKRVGQARRGAGEAADREFMLQALEEAGKGLGRTHPNPAVGAVIVQGGKVVARGYHAKAGLPHAEAVALMAAGARARGATLYSTLEPCDHQGRTPPCTAAILEAGVARVVFASSDPNPLVNGKGLARLRRHGVQVTPHVLRAAADRLNRPFFKAMRQGLPWVTLKAGVTLDGKLATGTGASKWITSEAARAAAAHRLRDRVDAVIVGPGTVKADDPRLTTRIRGGRTPVRVVIDAHLETDPAARVYETGAGRRTVIATLEPRAAKRARPFLRRGVELLQVRANGGHLDLEEFLRALAAEGLLHVLVEGGAGVHAAFLRAGLADEVVLFVAPKLFGHAGLTWSGPLDVASPAEAIALEDLEVERVGPDLMITAAVLPRRGGRHSRVPRSTTLATVK